MNYLVHSVMYTYYAFKAAKFRVPRGIAMVITTLQLIQMIVGTLVNYWTYQLKEDGMECQVSDTNIKLSLLMYISYFVLFARFFYNAYFQDKKVDRNGASKVVEQVNNLKGEEGKAINGALPKVEKKEKVQ